MEGRAVGTKRAAPPHPLMSLAIFKLRKLRCQPYDGGLVCRQPGHVLPAHALICRKLSTQPCQDRPRLPAVAHHPWLGIDPDGANLVRKNGFRHHLILGPSLVAIGMAGVCFLPVHRNYPLHVLPGLLIMPIGYGTSFAPKYAAATARVLGHFSGLITTSQQMVGAIGLAILSGVAATLTSPLTHDPAAQATDLWLQPGDGHLRPVHPDQRVRRDPRETHAQARPKAQPGPSSGNRSLVQFDHCPPPATAGVGSLAVLPFGDADNSSCASASMPHLTIP